MMKSASLKCSGVWMGFGEPTFPETNPALDGEFQIVWRAKQMQMIGHHKIIADKPCRGGVLPDFMQCALNRGLRQPSPSFLGADGEKYPVRSTERNVDTFGRRAASGVAKGSLGHPKFLTNTWQKQKILVRAERELCPTDQIMVGRRWQRHLQSLPPNLQKSFNFGISPAQKGSAFIEKTQTK
jgi:hypothetical protein